MDTFRIVAELFGGDSLELGTFDSKADALEKMSELVSSLKTNPTARIGNYNLETEDISFLGVLSLDSFNSRESLCSIGVFQGKDAHENGWEPASGVKFRFETIYGDTYESFVEAYANLSNYYLDGKLVSFDEAKQLLNSHSGMAYNFCVDLVKAYRGEQEGIISYNFVDYGTSAYGEKKELLIQTPSDPRLVLNDLSLHKPKDEFVPIRETDKLELYQEAVKRFDELRYDSYLGQYASLPIFSSEGYRRKVPLTNEKEKLVERYVESVIESKDFGIKDMDLQNIKIGLTNKDIVNSSVPVYMADDIIKSDISLDVVLDFVKGDLRKYITEYLNNLEKTVPLTFKDDKPVGHCPVEDRVKYLCGKYVKDFLDNSTRLDNRLSTLVEKLLNDLGIEGVKPFDTSGMTHPSWFKKENYLNDLKAVGELRNLLQGLPREGMVISSRVEELIEKEYEKWCREDVPFLLQDNSDFNNLFSDVSTDYSFVDTSGPVVDAVTVRLNMDPGKMLHNPLFKENCIDKVCKKALREPILTGELEGIEEFSGSLSQAFKEGLLDYTLTYNKGNKMRNFVNSVVSQNEMTETGRSSEVYTVVGNLQVDCLIYSEERLNAIKSLFESSSGIDNQSINNEKGIG